ncbi:MAG TPA: beta-N-acetylhexosaminidase [Candidatus Faecousia intestinigallinarum]|nr:beta-N-acetylhexosaminidase [Candidatus Faecousia intestinigallinarum]
MYTAVHLTGQLPGQYAQAVAALKEDLGMIPADTGIEICCRQGDELAVVSDGVSVQLTWAKPVQFYRALSLIPLPLTPCDIHEQARFETSGVMFDCSRNAVLKPEALRMFLRKMALMGLNLGMMYTEDTYEVPEQPFFGYKRGRYTYAELKELDDYADMLGIELCPCIQALGHLKRILHWPAFRHLRDNDEVLLADYEETYVLLEQMIRAASAPYRSKRIHLGMDEAFGVGMGAHFQRFGYEHPHSVIGRHLSRVLEICDKYGLKAMMWSDMYFHLDGRDYHSEGMPSQRAKDAVDPRVTLMYWDYYQADEAKYADALYKHAQFPAPTVFAGGLWVWIGPAPSYTTAIQNSVPGLTAAMKAHIPLVVATAWGDNGAETNMTAALLGMQLYGEMTYTGVYDPEALAARFRRCCDADAQAFLDLSLFNEVPGMHSKPGDPVNACKFMLYQDPLIQLFEADTAGFQMAKHYEMLVQRYARYTQENPAYATLFEFYTALAHALALKCAWHEQAADAVRGGDRERAAVLAEDLTATVEAVDTLRVLWRKLWESTNKPNGFEIIEVRLGGVCARLQTAQEKMRAFAGGQVDDIPELTEKTLICKRREDDSINCTNTMDEIATPGRIDY